MDKGCRDSGSLILGVQNSCLHEATKLAPTIQKEHVQISDDGVGLSNIKKPSMDQTSPNGRWACGKVKRGS